MQPDISKAIAYIKLDSAEDDGPGTQLDNRDEPVVQAIVEQSEIGGPEVWLI